MVRPGLQPAAFWGLRRPALQVLPSRGGVGRVTRAEGSTGPRAFSSATRAGMACSLGCLICSALTTAAGTLLSSLQAGGHREPGPPGAAYLHDGSSSGGAEGGAGWSSAEEGSLVESGGSPAAGSGDGDGGTSDDERSSLPDAPAADGSDLAG